MLTQARVKYLFNYDPLTGVLMWRVRPSRNMRAGYRAGIEDYQHDGSPKRRQVRIDGVSHNESHVIWLWMTGVYPTGKIDHADLDPFNNVWLNLREATTGENTANGMGRRPGRLKWTYENKYGKYQAQVRSKGVVHCVGTFDSEQEAHDAAYAVAQRLHGQFVRKD
jgi:hypothetical protein